MHGHGAKPHLCSYKDCERSAPGNGFPRRYNLFDHMKRVHDYKVPASSPNPSTEGTPKPAGPKRQYSRKRKPTGPGPDEAHASAKRIKVETSSKQITNVAITNARTPATPTSHRRSEMNQLETIGKTRYGELFDHIRLLEGHKDLAGLQKISNDVSGLLEIAEQLVGMN